MTIKYIISSNESLLICTYCLSKIKLSMVAKISQRGRRKIPRNFLTYTHYVLPMRRGNLTILYAMSRLIVTQYDIETSGRV